MLNGLDLFSGIGGISLALRPWVRTIAYCENDRYCQAVLLSRQSMGELDRAPIWDDVRTLGRGVLSSVRIDIIFGGFPCQDISAAGKGAGIVAGERSSLFVEILRLTKEIRPAFVFLENVPAIRTRGLGRVVSGLAGVGYDCRWTTVSAAEVGAPHLRKRWFLLAHARSVGVGDECGRSSGKNGKSSAEFIDNGAQGSMAHADSLRKSSSAERWNNERNWAEYSGKTLANTTSARCTKRLSAESGTLRNKARRTKSGGRGFELRDSAGPGLSDGSAETIRQPETHQEFERSDWWAIEPDVGRVVNGVPHRVDRLRALGNSVVPAQAREAFERLSGLNCEVLNG